MNAVQREVRVFWTAVGYFTRVPVPRWVGYDAVWLQATPRYFPVVGALVGGVGAAVWWAAARVLPGPIAILLSMAATILLTGAFHEDGFADVCDGFGGGWEKSQVLAIMKDSRVGAFGAIGVTLMLGLKAATLVYVPGNYVAGALIAGHAMSRWAAATMLLTHVYAREDAMTKAKPIATRLGAGALLVATIFGLAPLALLPLRCVWALLPLGLVRWVMARWFVRRIGGYTGDCLGALQQVGEVVFYLTIVALTWR
jgi:adenosylcobinamide-GDP ribazoletransferase